MSDELNPWTKGSLRLKAKNCTNTLITYFGNAVYTDSVAEWLERRGRRFKSRSDNQLVLFSVVPGSHSHATIV